MLLNPLAVKIVSQCASEERGPRPAAGFLLQEINGVKLSVAIAGSFADGPAADEAENPVRVFSHKQALGRVGDLRNPAFGACFFLQRIEKPVRHNAFVSRPPARDLDVGNGPCIARLGLAVSGRAWLRL